MLFQLCTMVHGSVISSGVQPVKLHAPDVPVLSALLKPVHTVLFLKQIITNINYSNTLHACMAVNVKSSQILQKRVYRNILLNKYNVKINSGYCCYMGQPLHAVLCCETLKCVNMQYMNMALLTFDLALKIVKMSQTLLPKSPAGIRQQSLLKPDIVSSISKTLYRK